MKCWKKITWGITCLCLISVLTGCGKREDTVQTEKNPAVMQTEDQIQNTTDRVVEEKQTAQPEMSESPDNGLVNDATDGAAGKEDGTKLGDAGADVIDGIGDAGKDLIDGVEQAGDALTGNDSAADQENHTD